MINVPCENVNETLRVDVTNERGDNSNRTCNKVENARTENDVKLTGEQKNAEGCYEFNVSDDLLGELRLDCNIVEGWIAERTAVPFNRELVASVVGNASQFSVREVDSPNSPYLHKPPSNAKYFQIDLTSVKKGKCEKDYLQVSIRERSKNNSRNKDLPTLMYLSASFCENFALNKNPALFSKSTVLIPEWKICSTDNTGLRVDEFSQNKPFRAYALLDPCMQICNRSEKPKHPIKDAQRKELVSPKRYARIAMTESMATDSVLTLSTLLYVNTELEEKELKLAMLLRADRTTKINARLLRNNIALSSVSFYAESHWTDVRRQFDGSLSLPRHATAEYKLEIDVVHRGRGYLDIVACSVSTNPSIQNILRQYNSDRTLSRSESSFLSDVNHVRNGEFFKWSKGFVFDRIEPRQETADAWRINCRKESSRAVQVSLFQLRESGAQTNTKVKFSFGLNICTQEFEGPIRLASIIGRDFQNAKNITLRFNVFAPNQVDPKRVIKRVALIGKSVGDEQVLHVFSRNLRIRFKDVFRFTISESEMVKIREQSSKHSNIQLCLDLEENTNIVLSSVQMNENFAEEAIAESLVDRYSHESRIDFEDPGIAEQAGFLKGLEDWRGESFANKVVSKKKDRGKKTGTGNSKSSFFSIRKKNNDSDVPVVDIVVPIYNALDAVKQCLQSIVKETSMPYTLHCIDDASSLETYDWLKTFCDTNENVRLLTNDENIGYTRTVNRGLEISDAEWICVLNSDAIVTSHWLERLVHVASLQKNIGIVSPLSNAASYQSVPRVHIDDNEDNGWCFNPLPENICPNDMAEAVRNSSLCAYPDVGVSNGFCQLINRKMLDEIGLLDEIRFPRGFGEENDLCVRAIKAGWTIKIADDTYVFHIKSQSFGHDQRICLSSQGKDALLKKHPDVDWNKITSEFQKLTPLIELRHRLIQQGL